MSQSGLDTIPEVSRMIGEGRVLLLAGDENLLSKLPAGKWIGGTSVNFVAGDGGTTERDRIFVTDITEHASEARIRRYEMDTLGNIGSDYSDDGFSVIIVPGMSDIHAMFAKDVQSFDGVFNSPLIGWISGVHLSEIGKRAPKCFAGTGAPLANEAVAMHVTLPPGEAAKVDIINLFKQGNGDVITFDTEGFASEGKCSIGGVPTSLASYIADRKIDTKLPLVADYNGAMINVSIQSVDTAGGKVQFYAPVFKDIKYRFAKPVPDYAGVFAEGVHDKHANKVAFSCNCILNYAYADLEGKKTGSFVGPVTFGEVAYMLLNQTLAYLSIEKVG
jgi:Family of unknown function (DUF6976)